jgi:hypothetical protein
METIEIPFFQGQSIEEIYDFGIKVSWSQKLVEKYPERLEEIAKIILKEILKLDSVNIMLHCFLFEDEEVRIGASRDDNLDLLHVYANLKDKEAKLISETYPTSYYDGYLH